MEQQIAAIDRHFAPDALAAHIPEGALKYLCHAIRPGALIARSARIGFHGRLRMRSRGPWLPFVARQGVKVGHGFQLHGDDVAAMLRIGPAGELRELHIDRWSDLTNDGNYAWIPFVSEVAAEQTFGDDTIPAGVRAACWAGTEREFSFFSATVDGATFQEF